MREALHWQKSTFSDGGDGNTCIEVATAAGSVHLRESDVPATEIATTPAALSHLIRTLKGDTKRPGPSIEFAFGADEQVYLRETSDPATVVTTTREKWDAFVLGVQAGEFDHFVADL